MKRNSMGNAGGMGMGNVGAMGMGNVSPMGMGNVGPMGMGNVSPMGMGNAGPMGMGNVSPMSMGNVGGMNKGQVAGLSDAGFCPDCPTQSIYDPPITVYEDYYHPQLVNVIQNIETVKQHHCCPVYKHHYTHTEKNVMVSGAKRRKSAKVASKKRSKK